MRKCGESKKVVGDRRWTHSSDECKDTAQIWYFYFAQMLCIFPFVCTYFTLISAFDVTCACVSWMFRRRRRQRALNAASGTVATSTAGTQSAATPSPRHATAVRTRSTVWTPSAHAHDRPRRRTSWSPAVAAMVGKSPIVTHFPLLIFTFNTTNDTG